MPTIEVVRINQIKDHVAAAIAQVNDGVAMARKQGIQAELPEKIDFQMNVVVEWQSMEIASFEDGRSAVNGKTLETGNTTATDAGTETSKTTGRQDSNETSKTTGSDSGTTTEKGTTKNDDASADNSTRTSNGTTTHTNLGAEVTETYE